jgi:hypothetical protein
LQLSAGRNVRAPGYTGRVIGQPDPMPIDSRQIESERRRDHSRRAAGGMHEPVDRLARERLRRLEREQRRYEPRERDERRGAPRDRDRAA